MARSIPPRVNGHHAYENFLEQYNIKHARIKPKTPQSNGIVERFNATPYKNFY